MSLAVRTTWCKASFKQLLSDATGEAEGAWLAGEATPEEGSPLTTALAPVESVTTNCVAAQVPDQILASGEVDSV